MGSVRADLVRPHPFAKERVGFISVRAAASSRDLVLIAEDYHPVADGEYVPDPSVGAMMGQEALRKALEFALLKPVGMLHVHMHLFAHSRLWFSKIDLSEQLKFVPDFFKVQKEMPHGALVLSPKAAAGRVWLSADDIVPIAEFNIAGQQYRVTRAQHDGSVDFEA